MSEMSPILEVQSLVKVYRVAQKITGEKMNVRALDGVDLSVFPGETLGVVGESGCGKSTLGRLVVSLDKPTAGSVIFKGRDVSQFKGGALKGFRREVQIVFQDPASSLNPRKTVGETLMEPLIIHDGKGAKEREERVREVLENVGLPAEYVRRFPHELSGGQRQRVGIARALVVAPELIVADEPVSSLDVSIQAQILNLLKDLRDRFNLTYIFISHDLRVVRFMSDRVAVMYGGRIVEIASGDVLYEKPFHPYTQALLFAIPSWQRSREAAALDRKFLSTWAGVSRAGCAFFPRCAERDHVCEKERAKLVEVESGHWVACHLFSKNNA